MTAILGGFALAITAGMLRAINPTPEPSNGPGTVHDRALTEHSTQAAGFHRGHSMRTMLAMSAAVVGRSDVGAVPLYGGLGKLPFAITTASPTAQRYFTQGLGFAYGFNHAGAISSFREAQRLDPGCAMCWWGEAFAHGPNINAPMEPAANARALAAANYANSLARSATPGEQALTAAMTKRYSQDPNADRVKLDAAFADAMLAAAATHPANDEIALLAAEAAMDTRPWDYWEADTKRPKARIAEAVRLVETVLARSPEHPQAAHLYIHLMEDGPNPKRAEHAADLLGTPLAPTLGHLVHMPAHIYYRLGRWQDSIRANFAAARADEAWIRSTGDKGLVRYGYYPHNVHFIVTSAQMSGEMPTAVREAQRLDRLLDPGISSKIAWIQAINAAPFFAAAQFATPAKILAMRAPDTRLPYPTAMRFYARAVARAHQGNRSGFEQELGKLRAVWQSADLKPMIEQGVPAPDLLLLAETIARARWAYGQRSFRDSARLYREAVRIESRIPYMEPPYWYFPVHQSLGAALYRAGRHREARDAFAVALKQAPNNGWALYGLATAERALGRRAQAATADTALSKSWSGDRRWLTMDRL
jgi:tetratricopeptide (TPR) repeat protein